jgi:hypothetical protein
LLSNEQIDQHLLLTFTGTDVGNELIITAVLLADSSRKHIQCFA